MSTYPYLYGHTLNFHLPQPDIKANEDVHMRMHHKAAKERLHKLNTGKGIRVFGLLSLA
jgi:hypothetical protein